LETIGRESDGKYLKRSLTIGSVHEGTVTQLTDKGATVTLPYGIDCFVGMRNLTKEDGSQVALEEKLPFKVLEFHKNNRRITISHTHTWEQDLKKEVGQRRTKRIRCRNDSEGR